MLHPQSTNETEIKLQVSSIPALRRKLRKLHARLVSPRTHEFNTLYDTPGRTLFKQGNLIRIRIDTPAGRLASPSKVSLTFKGPPSPAGATYMNRARYKIREEIESTIPSALPLERLFCALGLKPAFHYEKFRTTYVLPGIPGVKIELDETPAGNFLEIEGQPSGIDLAANRLGYSALQYSTRTYADIHFEKVRGGRRKSSDMLFPKRKSRKGALFP